MDGIPTLTNGLKRAKPEYYGAKIAVYEENGHVKGLIHFGVSLDDLIDEDEE